ncbi:hypothetical protein ACTXT7_008079 [Hymenolepis weldensis]
MASNKLFRNEDTRRKIISQTSITRLNKEVFRRLPSVAQIVLSHNNISEIEDGTFENVKNLQYFLEKRKKVVDYRDKKLIRIFKVVDYWAWSSFAKEAVKHRERLKKNYGSHPQLISTDQV